MRRAGCGVVATLLVLPIACGDDSSPTRSDRWTPLRDTTLARTEVAAARVGKRVYVIGGYEQQSRTTTRAVERYSITRDRWKRVRSMPVGLNHAVAVA